MSPAIRKGSAGISRSRSSVARRSWDLLRPRFQPVEEDGAALPGSQPLLGYLRNMNTGHAVGEDAEGVIAEDQVVFHDLERLSRLEIFVLPS